ncbi:hypothetical protein PG984_016515 [Apiospora sp. TS-2023a]
MRKTSSPKSVRPSQSQAPAEMDQEPEWQKEMQSVLETKAAGPTQTRAMLPITWMSGWSPATVKALLHEAVTKMVSGKVPLLQFSVPGDIVWQDFHPTPTDPSYESTMEKVLMGPPVTQERVMAFKCFMFVYIWTTQRAVLYGAHKEALYRARFTEKSLNELKHCETVAQLHDAIQGLVEEKL